MLWTTPGVSINVVELERKMGVSIVVISGKKARGLTLLKNAISKNVLPGQHAFVNAAEYGESAISAIREIHPEFNDYHCLKILNNYKTLDWMKDKNEVGEIAKQTQHNRSKAELLEINDRHARITRIVAKSVRTKKAQNSSRSDKIDEYVTHPVWGLLIFVGVFFLLFQAVFTLAQYPMEWVTFGMESLSSAVSSALPEGLFSDFLTQGLLAGIAGVLVFLPQIMILFGLIAILEDSGYLARVSFITDRVLRVFGMNGKSIVPLVGGFACAVPAIMAAKTIESRKERLITIFITPLMSCSARLPVYVFLVGFIVPGDYLWGVLSLQGLFLMGLYLLGIVFSLLIAMIINRFMKDDGQTGFLLELPNFKTPSLQGISSTMWSKGKAFMREAGKVILIASMVLWGLSSFGPSSQMERIEVKYASAEITEHYSVEEIGRMKSAEQMEYSYMGYIGKAIEPAIRPLGFDWKIGIAVVSSFAAREVFVGSMATIYSVEQNDSDKGALSGITFPLPVAFSLLIFYVFAMQCMSTVAIVRQESGSWKFAALQFFLFTGMAYLGSLITYQILA